MDTYAQKEPVRPYTLFNRIIVFYRFLDSVIYSHIPEFKRKVSRIMKFASQSF